MKWKELADEIQKIIKRNNQYPEVLLRYLVLAEDRRFWHHPGFDIFALLRALWKTKFKNKREGGSTIAMQLARIVTNNYEVSLKRKILEIYFAVRITMKFSRKDILNSYLTVAYFGWNMHGINQACRRLNIDINNISDYQAASIISRLKYPETKFLNEKNKQKIDDRAIYILKNIRKKT